MRHLSCRAALLAALMLGALGGCTPALISVRAPAACAGAPPAAPLPPKPYLPEVSAQSADCPYALCLDSANYAHLLERLQLLEEDDNRVRALCADELAANPAALAGAPPGAAAR